MLELVGYLKDMLSHLSGLDRKEFIISCVDVVLDDEEEDEMISL